MYLLINYLRKPMSNLKNFFTGTKVTNIIYSVYINLEIMNVTLTHFKTYITYPFDNPT